jgi:hypothetical protein
MGYDDSNFFDLLIAPKIQDAIIPRMSSEEINKVADKASSDLDQIANFIETAGRFFAEKYHDKTGAMLSGMALLLVGFIQQDVRRLQEAAQINAPKTMGHN